MGKIFVIGFHKTGTTSLSKALRTLGYRVDDTDWKAEMERLPAPVTRDALAARAQDVAQGFDAFEDNPWPVLYREMDAAFPGSKFILTLRDPNAWIGSVERHFGKRPSKMRAFIYGEDAAAPVGNADLYVARYERHNREVQDYFADRPDDLLTLRIEDADWPMLCTFLGKPEPMRPFPHANKAAKRESGGWLSRLLRRG